VKGKIRIRDFVRSDTDDLLGFREATARISFPGLRFDMKKARKAILEHKKKHPGTIKVAEIVERRRMQGRRRQETPSKSTPPSVHRKAIGFIRFRPKSGSLGECGYVNTVFVEKPYRKHGVGSLLLKEAEAWFRSRGLGRIEATVTSSNAHSIDFFKGHGYREKRTIVEKKI
jgi:ribosomal protein S18 acetylase RimI-like enzyme